MINTKVIKKTILKRCQTLGYNPFLGAKVRKRRLEKKLTLEEVCDGICSVSYLSKIETGKAKINDKFLNKILKKLELDSCVLDYDVQHDIMKNLIIAMLDENNKLFDDILVELKSDLDSHLYIVYKFLSCVKNKNSNEAKLQFNKILEIKDSFTLSDYYVLVLALVKCLLDDGNIDDVYSLFEIFDSILLCDFEYSDLLLSKYKLEASIRINDFYEANNRFKQLLNYYIDKENYKFIYKINHKIFLRRFICGYPHKKVLLNKNEKYIINAIQAIKTNDFSILKRIDDCKNEETNFYRLLVYDAFNKNNCDIISLYNYEGIKGLIVESLKKKNEGIEVYKGYLRDIAISKALKYGDRIAITYFKMAYIDLLASNSRYKEIYLIEQKLKGKTLD